MENIKKLLILFVFSISFITCNDNSVEPIEVTPGSRDYIWERDTLNLSLYHFLTSIWGSSENNVWMCGPGGMFNFNGVSWQEYPGMRWNLNCLYGISQNDIWTFAEGNYNGVNIWHYDGNAWNDLGLYTFTTIDGYLAISAICGTSANDLYAVGVFMYENYKRKSVLMHYNGVDWTFMNTGNLTTTLNQIYYDKYKKKYYMSGTEQIWDTTSSPPVIIDNVSKLYELSVQTLKEIYSSDKINRFISEINGAVYFISEDKLFSYSNNAFQVYQDFSTIPYVIGLIRGRSVKDLFIHSAKRIALTGNRYIVHFNGSDVQPIFDDSYIWTFEVIGKSVFILSSDENGTFIINHGKLKE